MIGFDHRSGVHVEVSGGARLYVESHGDEKRPVLLFLHGGLGTIADFNGLIGDLAGDFRVVGIDSRGHGASTLGAEPLSYPRLADDVERVCAHLGIRRASVIGFSDGGDVGDWLAVRKTLGVDRLVTIGGRFRYVDTEPSRPILEAVTADSWRAKFPATVETYETLNPEPDFARLVPLVVAMWLDPNGFPESAVETIDVPTLVVRGGDDHLVPREAAVDIVARIRGAQLLHVPFAAHVAFDDQREVCVRIFDRFLAA